MKRRGGRPGRGIGILSASVLVPLLLAACGEDPAFPDKTVVLTFDDACRSHLEFVAPILEKRGFGATFFISARWLQHDPRNYLTWEEVARLHARGFEIGNHSWSHAGFHLSHTAGRLEKEIRWVEEQLTRVGVPKPVSFAWPGDAFGPESREVLIRSGYRFARRGMAPERDPDVTAVGPAFDPAGNDPLLIPTAALSRRGFTFQDFLAALEQAKDGRAVILEFHGVPDPLNPDVSTSRETFVRYMDHLAANGYRVIAMRDLADYYDPEPLEADPLTKRRCPEEE